MPYAYTSNTTGEFQVIIGDIHQTTTFGYFTNPPTIDQVARRFKQYGWRPLEPINLEGEPFEVVRHS